MRCLPLRAQSTEIYTNKQEGKEKGVEALSMYPLVVFLIACL